MQGGGCTQLGDPAERLYQTCGGDCECKGTPPKTCTECVNANGLWCSTDQTCQKKDFTTDPSGIPVPVSGACLPTGGWINYSDNDYDAGLKCEFPSSCTECNKNQGFVYCPADKLCWPLEVDTADPLKFKNNPRAGKCQSSGWDPYCKQEKEPLDVLNHCVSSFHASVGHHTHFLLDWRNVKRGS